MATIIQLSEATYLNIDAVLLIRVTGEEVRVYGHAQAPPLLLTPDESTVLAHYLRKHTSRLSYTAVRREQSRVRYEEPEP